MSRAALAFALAWDVATDPTCNVERALLALRDQFGEPCECAFVERFAAHASVQAA